MAQNGFYVNGNSAALQVDSSSFIFIDGDFQNQNCDPILQVRFNGALHLTGSLINNDSLKFSPASSGTSLIKSKINFISSITNLNSGAAVIGGTVTPKLWQVEMNKGIGLSLNLNNNVYCLDTLSFISGLLFVNGYKWHLIDPVGAPSVLNHPFLKNERHGCQFFVASNIDTGMIIYKTIYNYSVDVNPGNIGIEFTGLMNIGSPLHIYRGFKAQINAAKGGLIRYFDIYSPGHPLVNNSVKVKYTHNDKGYFNSSFFNFNSLKIYCSPLGDMDWNRLPSSFAFVPNPIDGIFSANLSDLRLPNVSLDSTAFRITIADSDCPFPPTSNLLLDTLHLCAGNTVVLDGGNNTSIPNTSLKWEWQTPASIYTRTLLASPTNGYQKFKLKLIDVKGCESHDSVVVAPAAPFPVITYFNHLNSCLGDSVTFKDSVVISSGSFVNQWIFSDASSLNTQLNLFKKKFQGAGIYSAQLNITSNHGCTASATSTNIIVYPNPTASFSHSLNCSMDAIQFNNSSESNYSGSVIVSHSWALGSGYTSTLVSPVQSYSSSGSYTVKLVVGTNFGCVDSALVPLTIFPKNIAAFTKSNVCDGDTVYFNNTSSCGTGTCLNTWKFGDGTLSNIVGPKKTYASAGLYSVKLILSNSTSCADSVATTIFVNPRATSNFSIASTNACINIDQYFPNTSTISTGAINSFTWNYGNTLSANSLNGSTSYSNAGQFSVSLIAMSDSGCVSSAIKTLAIHPQPIAQYAVSNVCLGYASQFISNSSGTNLSYNWNFGNTVTSGAINNSLISYSYSSSGSYSTSLIITDIWGCIDTNSVIVLVKSIPFGNLGGIISTCGDSYTLNAYNSGASYLWQPGNQTSAQINVLQSGNYKVTITGSNSCSSTESVQVILNSIVKPKLGKDTTVCGSILLNAGYPGSIYNWNTSANTQTILTNISGSIVVNVTDLNGCSGGDTINVTINNLPAFSLGADKVICKPKYGFDLFPNQVNGNFLWNDGSQTTTLRIFESGYYWLEVKAANGCKLKDTILITFLSTPMVDLGKQKSSCGEIVLDGLNSGKNFLWSTGVTTSTVQIQNTGTYWVQVSDPVSGCSVYDTVHVYVYPSVTVNLGLDTSICDNTTFVINANNASSTYKWTNGVTTQTTLAGSSGVYGVTVTSQFGCNSTDYISITILPSPVVDLGVPLRYKCGTKPVNLENSTPGTPHWSSDKGYSSFSNSIVCSIPGKYWLEVSQQGCSATDTVRIVETANIIEAMFLVSTIDTINRAVQFVNLSKPNPISQVWEFGDGYTSNEINPVHTFVTPQDFSVSLEVSNGYCIDKISKSLNALFRETQRNKLSPVFRLEVISFALFPNPTNEILNLRLQLNTEASMAIRITDLLGKVVYDEVTPNDAFLQRTMDLKHISNGAYFFSFTALSPKGNIFKTSKFIKTE